VVGLRVTRPSIPQGSMFIPLSDRMHSDPHLGTALFSKSSRRGWRVWAMDVRLRLFRDGVGLFYGGCEIRPKSKSG